MSDVQDRLESLEDATAERRKAIHDLRNDVQTLYQRMGLVEGDLTKNTRITEAINSDTKDILDIVNSVKGGMRVLGWLGSVAKWVGGIAAAVAGVYTVFQKFRG